MPSSGDPTAQTLLGHLTDRAGAHDIGDLTLDDTDALANLAASAAFAGQYGTVYSVAAYGATGDGSTDDTAAIQAAIDACEAADPEGGTVYFPPGVYQCSGVASTAAGVHFRGSGMGEITGAPIQGATVLRAASLSGDLLTVGGPFSGVSDMTLDGGDTGDACLKITRSRTIVERLMVRDAGGAGILIEGTVGATAHAVKLSNIYITSCVGSGLSAQAYSYDLQAQNIWIAECAIGFECDGGAAIVSNLHTWGNTSDGIEVRSDGNMFTNIYAESNGSMGIDLPAAAMDNSFVGGRIWRNTTDGVNVNGTAQRNKFVGLTLEDNGRDGIRFVSTASRNIVSACVAFDDQGTKTQDYGFNVSAAGCTSNIITSCVTRAADHTTGSINDAGTSTVTANNVT